MLRIENSSAEEGAPIQFAVEWVSGDLPCTVHYAVQSGSSATAGIDYVLCEGTLTLDAAHRVRTIIVDTLEDALCEPDESFPVVVSADPTHRQRIAIVTGTILEDDDCRAPTIATHAAASVVISEVAWSGTDADPDDEWIELVNVGDTAVDLTGWTLRWRPLDDPSAVWTIIELYGTLDPLPDLSPPIVEKNEADATSYIVTASGSSDAAGFFLVERGADTTVEGVRAGLVYDEDQMQELPLPDQGALIHLVDARGRIADTANAGLDTGWAAGSAAMRASMERIDPRGADVAENWRTSSGIVSRGSDAGGHALFATAAVENDLAVLEAVETAVQFIVVKDEPGADFSAILDPAAIANGSQHITCAEVHGTSLGTFEPVASDCYTISAIGRVEIDVRGAQPGRYIYRFGCTGCSILIIPVEVRS